MATGSEAQRGRSANWRKAKEKQGMAQTQVWLDAELRSQIDLRIAAGEFKNRSEAVETALVRLMQGDNIM